MRYIYEQILPTSKTPDPSTATASYTRALVS